MLDRSSWRKKFVAAAKAEIAAGRLNRAAMARHFETLPPPARPATKQAVYEWFRTGKISDDRLAQVAAYQQLDLPLLKFEAIFRYNGSMPGARPLPNTWPFRIDPARVLRLSPVQIAKIEGRIEEMIERFEEEMVPTKKNRRAG